MTSASARRRVRLPAEQRRAPVSAIPATLVYSFGDQLRPGAARLAGPFQQDEERAPRLFLVVEVVLECPGAPRDWLALARRLGLPTSALQLPVM